LNIHFFDKGISVLSDVSKIINEFKEKFCSNSYDIDSEGNFLIIQGEEKIIVSNCIFIPREAIYSIQDGEVVLTQVMIEGVANNNKKLPKNTINIKDLTKKKWINDMYPFGALGEKPNKNLQYILRYIENSIDMVTKVIEFNCTGWFRFRDQWHYLYSNGYFNVDGIQYRIKFTDSEFNISLNDKITPKEAFIQSLELLDLCNNQVTYSLLSYTLASLLLTPLSNEKEIVPSFSMWLYGKTGLGKTQLATLFTRISNLENLIFVDAFKNDLKKANKNNKDSVLIIDDFGTSKNTRDEKLTVEKVERFIRALSDNSNTLDNTINPQGLFLFTGEKYLDINEKTESTSKRTIRVKMDNIFNRTEKGYCEARVNNFKHFSEGAFLQTSIFYYIKWLSSKLNNGLLNDYKEDFEKLRTDLTNNDHPRIIDSIAHMITSFNLYIAFGKDQGFITQQQSIDYCNKAKSIFYIVMEEQQKPVPDPLIQLFFDTIKELLKEGKIIVFQAGDITHNGEINNDKKIYGKMDLEKRSLSLQWEKVLEIADEHLEKQKQHVSLLSKSKTLGKKLKEQKFIKVRLDASNVTIQKQVISEGRTNRGRFIEFNTDKIPEIKDLIIKLSPLPDFAEQEEQYSYNQQYYSKKKRKKVHFIQNGEFEQF
jgi:hypothetical protein